MKTSIPVFFFFFFAQFSFTSCHVEALKRYLVSNHWIGWSSNGYFDMKLDLCLHFKINDQQKKIRSVLKVFLNKLYSLQNKDKITHSTQFWKFFLNQINSATKYTKYFANLLKLKTKITAAFSFWIHIQSSFAETRKMLHTFRICLEIYTSNIKFQLTEICIKCFKILEYVYRYTSYTKFQFND